MGRTVKRVNTMRKGFSTGLILSTQGYVAYIFKDWQQLIAPMIMLRNAAFNLWEKYFDTPATILLTFSCHLCRILIRLVIVRFNLRT